MNSKLLRNSKPIPFRCIEQEKIHQELYELETNHDEVRERGESREIFKVLHFITS